LTGIDATSVPNGGDGRVHPLTAASHPVDQRVAGDAVPVAEFPELLEINLIGQDTQRLVSRLLVAQAAQSVSQPLPAVSHGSPKPCLQLDATA
jgi:hypothetical protein